MLGAGIFALRKVPVKKRSPDQHPQVPYSQNFFERERERKREWGEGQGKRERERKKENLKQVPHPAWGSGGRGCGG